MTDLSSWTAYFNDFGQFFNGFLFTIALSIGSFILAMILGIFFGSLSTSKNAGLRLIARIFVEFYQNTPLLVQFVIVFYGLPLITNHVVMIPIYWTGVLESPVSEITLSTICMSSNSWEVIFISSAASIARLPSFQRIEANPSGLKTA